jgi:uncharacterized membrane protein
VQKHSLPFRERLALSLVAKFASWTWILTELSVIVIWVILNGLGIMNWDAPPFVFMGILIAILTLFLDNVILIANSYQNRSQTKMLEYMIELGKAQLASMRSQEENLEAQRETLKLLEKLSRESIKLEKDCKTTKNRYKTPQNVHKP